MSSINIFAGLGVGQRRPQQHGGCSGGGRKNKESVQVTDLVKYKTTGTSADCGRNSDHGADEALHEVKAAGAGRYVGNHQHREHGDGGGAEATQALADEEAGVACIEGEYQSAQRLDA